MGLDGPSREIIYEPEEQPAKPQRDSEPTPRREPAPETTPEREPEKVPA